MVLGSVCSSREDVEDLMVLVVEATTIYLELCFNIRLLGIEVDFAFFVTYESIRVIELCSMFRSWGFSRGLSLLPFKVFDSTLFL
jgi:hypothetical protein